MPPLKRTPIPDPPADPPPGGPLGSEPPFAEPAGGSRKPPSRAKAEAAAGSLFTPASVARGEEALPFAAQAEPGPGFGRIIERVFDLPDPEAEYQALEAALGAGSREQDSVAQALDGAEDYARRAHRLYVNAKVDLERFQADCDTVEGAMREQAVAALTVEKERGVRTKQITDADVRHRAAVMYPDEWRDALNRKAKGEGAVKHLERLADLWQGRCRSLAALLGRR